MSVANAGSAPATFEIKSANLALVLLRLKSTDLSALADDLTRQYGDIPDFFDNEPLVIDLTVLSGTYVMVSMLLNATQVGIPGGGAEPLQVLDPIEIRQRLLG